MIRNADLPLRSPCPFSVFRVRRDVGAPGFRVNCVLYEPRRGERANYDTRESVDEISCRSLGPRARSFHAESFFGSERLGTFDSRGTLFRNPFSDPFPALVLGCTRTFDSRGFSV